MSGYRGKLANAVTILPLVIAALAILVMAGVTLADILARNLFGSAIIGAYEVVQISLCVTIFAGLSEATRHDAHIALDLIDTFLTPRRKDVLRRLSEILLAVLFGIFVYAGLKLALTSWKYGELTSDLRMSKLVFWVPVLAGLAGSVLVALFRAFHAKAGER